MGKLLLAIMLSTASLIGCQDKQNQTIHPEELIGSWIHSHEDDTDELKVYRPASYAFPPARGREGFEIKEGGECIYHGIAPADGSTNEPANWSWADGNKLTIKRKAEGAPEIVMEVVSVSKEMLNVRK